ncbi:hypothetical protein LP419_32165 [Massilia sp. H-1]|nr:hypothetical protein LP419_32165 [Massilia sp. H-1]
MVGTLLIGDERQSFVWRDNKMIVHRGGKGLHVINGINNREQVIGATFDKRLDAATMPSAAVPVVDHGGQKLSLLIVFAIVAAALGVAVRRYLVSVRAPDFA